MKKRLFKTARAAALASLLSMHGPLVLRGQAAPAIQGGQEFAAFIDKFWQEAWGSQFVLNQSGMLMQEIAPGVFGVQVSDGEGIVASGTWFEILRLDEPQLGGPPDLGGTPGLLAINQAVTAGVLVGSTGSVSFAYGLDVITTTDGPSGHLVVESFTPIGVASNPQGAGQAAYDLHAALNAAVPVLAGNDFPAEEEDFCRCQERYDNDRLACMYDYLECHGGCLIVLIGALVACAFLGPFAPLCQAAAAAAYTVCLLGCLASEAACLRHAANKFIECQEDCADLQDHLDRQLYDDH